MSVNGLVRASGQVPAPDDAAGDEWTATFTTALTANPDRFPALTAAATAGGFGPSTGDFTFGLNLVLDGIEALLSRRDPS